MQTTRRARYLAALAATTLALSACGGGDDDSSDDTSSDTSTTQSESTGEETSDQEDQDTDSDDQDEDADSDEDDQDQDQDDDSTDEASTDEDDSDASSSEGSVTASQSGVTFDVPDGWTAVDPNKLLEDSGDAPEELDDLAEAQGTDAETYLQNIAQSVDVMIIGETKDDFAENVNVISSPTKPSKDESVSQLEQVGATVEGTDDVDTELGSAFDTTYTLSANGQDVHGRSLMIPTDSGAALITVSATSADSADEIATTILESVDKA